MLTGQPKGLSESEIHDLHLLAEPLKAACAELADAGLPYTLEHGDFHGNNVNVTDYGHVIYDWTDGCVTHPFFCLAPLSEETDPEIHDRCVRAYLNEWAAYAAPDRLQAALRLARPLGILHLAVSYHDIRLNTEPASRHELEGALPFWLKELLNYKEPLLAL